MICPNCGVQIPEGATVCPTCGTAVTTPEAPKPLAPNGKPLKKRNYLWSAAPSQTKLLNKIAYGIGALCLILVILAANTAINGEFFNIPVIKMAFDADEYDEMMEELDEMREAVDEAIEEDDDDLIDELEDEYDISIKEFQKAINPFSLSSASKLGALIDADDAVNFIISTVITVIVVYAIVIAFFTALAVFFGKTGLMIFAFLLSLPFTLLMAGTVYMVLFAIAYIGYAVLCSKLNKEYKAYKKSVMA